MTLDLYIQAAGEWVAAHPWLAVALAFVAGMLVERRR